MTKRLEITPKIAAAIARSTDSSVDPNTVAVFETAALNTLPLNKKGGLFDQARASETTLRQMADYLNQGTNYAPLHVEHDQGGNLPVGRVFAGEVVTSAEGYPELRNLFYVPLSTGADLIGKLESAVIDEVSVGLKSSHINCSECGFDYLGADSTYENIWMRTCNNDHEIGVNGVHTILNGMDKYMELSLVSRGAAQKTKIVAKAKSLLGEDGYKALAASGHQPEATLLFASPTHPVKKENSMDINALVDQLTTTKASVIQKDSEIAAVKAENVTLNASVTNLTAEVATLKAAAAPADVTAKLTAAEAAVVEATTFVREEAVRLTTAAGLPALAEGIGFADLKAAITTARTKLQETLPVGGISVTPGTEVKASADTQRNNLFKTA